MKASLPARLSRTGISRTEIAARILEHAYPLQCDEALACALAATHASEFDLNELRLGRIKGARGRGVNVGFRFVFEGQRNELEPGLNNAVGGHAVARLSPDGTVRFDEVRIVADPQLSHAQRRKQTAFCTDRKAGKGNDFSGRRLPARKPSRGGRRKRPAGTPKTLIG